MVVDVLSQANILILIIVILLSSLISLRLGMAVAIIELILGAIFGNLGILHPSRLDDSTCNLWRHSTYIHGRDKSIHK